MKRYLVHTGRHRPRIAGPFRRLRDRLAGARAWLFFPEEWEGAPDDLDVAAAVGGMCEACAGGWCGRAICVPEDDCTCLCSTWATEDVPRPESGRRESSNIGPGHFHDDAPAEYIPTARLGDNTFVPLTDDTIIDMRPEPRAGRPVWAPPRPAHPPWVQRILDAPIAELRRALEAPDTDAYLWNMAQRRAIEAA